MLSPTLPQDGRGLREQLIAIGCAMNALHINVNKSGNVSARCSRGTIEGMLITPTAVPYLGLTEAKLAFVPFHEPTRPIGPCAPSSEWRFHFDIYRSRAAFGAIVHTHSPAATALAVHGRGLPAFHYMVAMAGGHDIRCAPYATFGSQELSDHALLALADRKACLLAHHGVIACETDLDRALALAVEVEHLAGIYLRALALGEPALLSADEMRKVVEKFSSYGVDTAAPPRAHRPALTP